MVGNTEVLPPYATKEDLAPPTTSWSLVLAARQESNALSGPVISLFPPPAPLEYGAPVQRLGVCRTVERDGASDGPAEGAPDPGFQDGPRGKNQECWASGSDRLALPKSDLEAVLCQPGGCVARPQHDDAKDAGPYQNSHQERG